MVLNIYALAVFSYGTDHLSLSVTVACKYSGKCSQSLLEECITGSTGFALLAILT